MEVHNDVEEIWALVQRHGGEIALHRDRIDFWIPLEYQIVLQIAYPELVREQRLDYGKYQRYQFRSFDEEPKLLGPQ